MNFVEKVKGFLVEPSKTFDASKEDTLGEALKYYAIITVIFAAIFALFFALAGAFFISMMGLGSLGPMAGAGVGISMAIGLFVVILVFGIIGAFVGGAILHIGVYIAGGRKGIKQTIKILMYGSTPRLLLGWIPLINIIASIWSLILYVIGIRQLHEITTGRAIVAVIIPLIIVALLVIIFIVLFVASLLSTVPSGTGY